MNDVLKKVVRSSMSDLYNKVLSHYAQYEAKPTGANVLETFNTLSNELMEVSQQAMRDTQLSLFESSDSAL